MSNQSVAIVTGGASGIGLGIASALIAEGYDVFVLDNDVHHVDDYNTSHPLSRARLCDVSDASAVATEVDGVLHVAGRINLLVNNAGISGPMAPIEVVDPSEWQKTLDVGLTGAVNATRSVAPIMKEQSSGAIINIASNAGLMGCPNRSPYVATKWGLIGLTKTWAMELGPYNIRVNALCPASVSGFRIDGVIERDALARGVTPEAVREVYQRQSSLRTFTKSEDISAMVCYLAGPGGQRISGQAIALDGHTETLTNWL
jgi:NAD(P)-dependent dehydrogenase (short-subunit alcohol dehydrogenase family)